MKVYIRKKDIEAWQGLCDRCPIERALDKRANGYSGLHVDVPDVAHELTAERHLLSPAARRFVRIVDGLNWRKAKPGWLEVWK